MYFSSFWLASASFPCCCCSDTSACKLAVSSSMQAEGFSPPWFLTVFTSEWFSAWLAWLFFSLGNYICINKMLKQTENLKCLPNTGNPLIVIQSPPSSFFFKMIPSTTFIICYCCSITQLCLTLCNPGNCSMPGFPVFQYLPEFVQTHVHWVGEDIQPAHPLLPPSLASVFPSIMVFSNESSLRIRWPKDWSFSFSISPSNEYSGLISFRMGWLDLLTVQGDSDESSPAPQIESVKILQNSAFSTVQLTSVHDHWKNQSLDYTDLIFIYLFLAAWFLGCHPGSSLIVVVVGVGGTLQLCWAGFSLSQSPASRLMGFSSCGSWTLELWLNSCGTWS